MQNGQTHSTNCVSVFDHFVGLALKGLKLPLIIKEKNFDRSFPDSKRKSDKDGTTFEFSYISYNLLEH